MKIEEFEKDGQRVILGNCLQALDSVQDESIDLIFADPPYNIGKKFGSFIDKWESEDDYADWSKLWLEKAIRKLKPNGSLYVMSSTQCIPYIDLYLRTKLTILSRIIWSYDSSGVQAKTYFGSMYEPIIFAVKDPKNYTFNADEIRVEAKTGAKRKLIDYRKAIPTQYNTTKIPGNVWEFARVRYRMEEYEVHPTQKPEALLERIITASTKKGDIVLDPFAGTFTTCAVAKKLGRKSIGIELNSEYCKIGLRRLDITKVFHGEKLARPTKSYSKENNMQLDM